MCLCARGCSGTPLPLTTFPLPCLGVSILQPRQLRLPPSVNPRDACRDAGPNRRADSCVLRHDQSLAEDRLSNRWQCRRRHSPLPAGKLGPLNASRSVDDRNDRSGNAKSITLQRYCQRCPPPSIQECCLARWMLRTLLKGCCHRAKQRPVAAQSPTRGPTVWPFQPPVNPKQRNAMLSSINIGLTSP